MPRSPRHLLQKVPVFTDLTETERSTISNRSIKLFTLSGIYHATQTLLAGTRASEPLETQSWSWRRRSGTRWPSTFPDWGLAKERKVSAADLRRDYIHAHTLALAALARAGSDLLTKPSPGLEAEARPSLGRSTGRAATRKLWEGRAMSAGRLSKKTVNVVLTGNLIKKHLGLKLVRPTSSRLENDILRSRKWPKSA